MPATPIDGVIEQLETIVRDAYSSGDAQGIFASLYLEVTKGVKSGIAQGAFEDGPRMERLDVIFANRYLDAFDRYQRGESCTTSWRTAFEAAQKQEWLVLQHLLMGMNAHINLDLGIAASESVPSDKLTDLEGDFMAINQLLSSKIDAVQAKLNAVSPLLFLLDWFGQRKDEKIAEFSLIQARNHAWRTAQRLSTLPAAEKDAAIEELDSYVAALNRLIIHPGRLGGWVLRLVKRFEKKEVRQIMEVMHG